MRENRSNNNMLMVLMAVITIAALIFAFMFRGPLPEGEVGPKEVPAPAQAIDLKVAQELQREFVSTRAGIINDSLKITDTRDFWFSLETMEQYIDYVKSEGQKKEYKDMGIRIFYAAYPKHSSDKRADAGYSTVVLVPTTGKEMVGNGFFPMAPFQETAGGIKSLNYGHGGRPPTNP
ncbi:hypothetical protein [Maribacter halichondriae]|uniref:hypothetical protein n=1 Tax=Maribacter halichondriae TaxID=2980554 RepID=UPI002358F71D|nr:hypothetical protein [Maribacter sp. Hal144]